MPITTLSMPSHRTLAESLAADIAEALSPSSFTSDGGTPLSSANMPWRDWVAKYFPYACTYDFSPRHVHLWEWFDSLERGVSPPPEVCVWPRGGAKSASAEMGVVRLCAKLTRRLVLYVSSTQDQAEKHVQSIASLMENIGVDRKMNQFGVAKGWRRSELQTANGFNVVAFGLDTAPRGLKLEQFRPDVIILDDIDVEHDTPRIIEKKIDLITKSLLPAGSGDCAVLFLQNKIHEDGIVSQLCDGRADFLHDKNAPIIEPAIWDMQYEITTGDKGNKQYKITGGTSSWEGQSIEICERWIARIGIRAFLKEMQHEVAGLDGVFFNTSRINYIEINAVPQNIKMCRGWDLAGTEGGGDYTAGALCGIEANGNFYIMDLQHGQWGSDNVRAKMKACAVKDPPGCKFLFPHEPNQAGTDQKQQLEERFKQWNAKAVSTKGSKAVRAEGLQECLNLGNVYVVRAEWNIKLKKELQDFREDESHLNDDIVDALSTCYNGLHTKRRNWDDLLI